MKELKFIVGGLLFFSAFFAKAQTVANTNKTEIQLKVDFVAQDSVYLVKLHKNPSLFYFYIISGEPIPELEDKDLFINIVDSDSNGWPVVETGYIDTRYGVNEFAFDLQGKNFYLMATNGEEYSKVTKFDFFTDQ
jgi:hypothetical protein